MRKILTFLVALAAVAGGTLASLAITPQQYATMLLTGAGRGAPPAYTANAVSMNSGFWMSKGSALTGVSDSKVGTLSFWYKPHAGTDAQTHRLLQADSAQNTILVDRLATSGTMRIILANAAGTTIAQFASTSAFLIANNWRHCLVSWNLATATFQMYVNDSADASTASPLTNDTIAYATHGNTWFSSVPGLEADADIADLWFDTGVVFASGLDLSVTANRRKFISAVLAPVNLGTDGSTPGGIIPPIYAAGPAAGFTTNKGAGGGFTLGAGSVSAASTNPP
jgi:hypothetical protein